MSKRDDFVDGPPNPPEIAPCNARCQTTRGAEERCPGSRSFLVGLTWCQAESENVITYSLPLKLGPKGKQHNPRFLSCVDCLLLYLISLVEIRKILNKTSRALPIRAGLRGEYFVNSMFG